MLAHVESKGRVLVCLIVFTVGEIIAVGGGHVKILAVTTDNRGYFFACVQLVESRLRLLAIGFHVLALVILNVDVKRAYKILALKRRAHRFVRAVDGSVLQKLDLKQVQNLRCLQVVAEQMVGQKVFLKLLFVSLFAACLLCHGINGALHRFFDVLAVNVDAKLLGIGHNHRVFHQALAHEAFKLGGAVNVHRGVGEAIFAVLVFHVATGVQGHVAKLLVADVASVNGHDDLQFVALAFYRLHLAAGRKRQCQKCRQEHASAPEKRFFHKTP